MKPTMKTRTKPALTESVNSGLRPPIDGSIIMSAQVQIDVEDRRSDESRRRQQMSEIGV